MDSDRCYSAAHFALTSDLGSAASSSVLAHLLSDPGKLVFTEASDVKLSLFFPWENYNRSDV